MDIQITSNREPLFSIQISNIATSQPGFTTDFSQQQNLPIPCNLQESHEGDLFWLPVMTISQILNDIAQRLSQLHHITHLKRLYIDTLECLLMFKTVHQIPNLLSNEQEFMISTLIYCLQNPACISKESVIFLQQSGITLTKGKYKLVEIVDKETIESTYMDESCISETPSGSAIKTVKPDSLVSRGIQTTPPVKRLVVVDLLQDKSTQTETPYDPQLLMEKAYYTHSTQTEKTGEDQKTQSKESASKEVRNYSAPP